jgi:Ribonuclease toxin, BrnT, of type II toxin-antitoxin system
MPLTFEWDSRKARANVAKHGVCFEEASTIFGDRLSLTIPDPNIRWAKSVTSRWAERLPGNCSLLSILNEAIIFVLSAQGRPAEKSASFMKKSSNKSAQKQIPEEYDFSRGERGKYARRYAQGTNVVVLEPDVAKVFSSSKAVNASLRKIIRQREVEVAK